MSCHERDSCEKVHSDPGSILPGARFLVARNARHPRSEHQRQVQVTALYLARCVSVEWFCFPAYDVSSTDLLTTREFRGMFGTGNI